MGGGDCGVLSLLVVLLAAVAVSTFLGSPEAQAFPQNIEEDYHISAPGYGGMVLAPVNADPLVDLVVSAGSNSVQVYSHSQTEIPPYVDPSTTINVPGVHKRILVDDLSNDTKADVAVLSQSAGLLERVYIAMQPGTGFPSYKPYDVVLRTYGAIDATVGPVIPPSSGKALFVLYPGRVLTYPNFGVSRGYFNDSIYVTLNDTLGYQNVISYDMDGNGFPDIVLSAHDRIKVFFNGPTGIDYECNTNCTTYPVSDVLEGDVSVYVSDVTSDQVPDIVMAVTNETSRNGNIRVLAGERPIYAPLNLTEVANATSDFTDQLDLADFNGDGITDIAVALYSSRVAILYQPKNGIELDRVDLLLNGTAVSGIEGALGHGDFNRDGLVDIVLRTANYVLVYSQEDLPVRLAVVIPSQCPPPVPLKYPPICYFFNIGSSGNNLIDLSDYFVDDHGPISYKVTTQESPNLRAAIDLDGHHLDFVADPWWFGVAKFRVEANDGYQGPTIHEPAVSEFKVMVNAPPEIVSTPLSQVVIGEEFRYQPEISDPFPLPSPADNSTGDVHTFSLLEAPQNATMDVDSGLFRWWPEAAGNYNVSIRVTDAFGASSEVHRFSIAAVAQTAKPPNTPLSLPIPSDAATIAALSVLFGTLLLVGAVIALNENAKYATLILFLPLYSKIRREKVLDHFIRGQIFGYIMANPGEHYNAIKLALDITNGSLAHHLKTLEREHFIKSKRFGLYRRFYPWAMRVPEDGYFQINEIQKNILDLCRHQPGISQKELAASLNLTPPTINYHVTILAEHGHVTVLRHGRRTQVYVMKGGTGEAH